MIEIVPYNPLWPELFKAEAKQLKKALGEDVIEVYHIGSTSVPGLSAKPKIDIIVELKKRLISFEPLEEMGYTGGRELNIPFKLYFKKGNSSLGFNLHVYEEGNSEIELNLKFRDYLINHPETQKEYAELKLSLASQKSLHGKQDQMFSGYNLGKDRFIKKVLKLANFNKFCMRFCTHYDEWEAARRYRQENFFDKLGITDPYTWTFSHKDHVHFIFYQGVQIIGYVHIQLWPNQRAALRIIVMENQLRGKGIGTYFLRLCEEWLKRQQYRSFHVEASPAAYKFYIKQGYQEMPFNDPDGNTTHPDDTAVGKILNL